MLRVQDMAQQKAGILFGGRKRRSVRVSELDHHSFHLVSSLKHNRFALMLSCRLFNLNRAASQLSWRSISMLIA